MKKRLLSILLAAVLAGSAAVGCGGGSSSASGGNTPAASATAEAAADKGAALGEEAAAAENTALADGAAEEPASGSTASETAAPAGTAETAAGQAALVTTGGQPWIDSDLKANLTEDMELSPTEDFHLFVNHDWLMKTELPSGYRSYNSFSEIQDEIEKKGREVLTDESLEGHDAELVQSLYNSILDWDARDAAGMDPVSGTVEEIRAVSSIEELSDFLCDPERSLLVPAFLGFANTTDFNDSTRYITAVGNDSFILEDAAEYKTRTEMGDRAYEAGLYAAKELLPRLGYTEDEAADIFEAVIDLEGKLAEVSMTAADQMKPDYYDRIQNIMSPEELAELSPVFPLAGMCSGAGYDNAEKYMVIEPEYIRRLNELYTEENLESLKDYMIFKYVYQHADCLDSQAYDVYVRTDNMKKGSSGRQEDEKVAYDIVRGSLFTPMDRAYLERYDASDQKEQITGICKDVIATYREMLSEEDWLSEETRSKAIEKLDNIRINAVYPDKWSDYSGLDLTGLSYMDCMKAIERFDIEYDKSHTNGTVDPEIWEFDILETNAYYNPQDNSVNIILGILGAPFYYDGISREELLGGIGTVIGHEISHAFDTSGAQFDKDGNYADWWTPEDYEAFQARADKLIKYYDEMTAWEGQNVIGSNIQTEAIADMAGIKSMLRIAKQEEDFDYKAFFTTFATVWRRINTREIEYYCLTQDPHPLHYLRTNAAVQQFDEFNEAFGVQEGDTMYLAPEDRVLVW